MVTLLSSNHCFFDSLTLYNLELLVAVGTVVEPSKLGPVYQVNSADVDINIGSIAVRIYSFILFLSRI